MKGEEEVVVEDEGVVVVACLPIWTSRRFPTQHNTTKKNKFCALRRDRWNVLIERVRVWLEDRSGERNGKQ